MNQTLWAILAGIIAVSIEWSFRVHQTSWWEYAWYYVPAQIALSICLFYMVTSPGTTLLDAFVVWAMCTIGLRVLVSVFILQEAVAAGTWAALGLIVAARTIQVVWK